jgi:pimeloyl-ACP methyl ester carboxylesterase
MMKLKSLPTALSILTLLVAAPVFGSALGPKGTIRTTPFSVVNGGYTLHGQLNDVVGADTVVLFFQGSGVLDRWETMPGNITTDGSPAPLFRPISDELNRRGLATAVFDKRGFAEKSGPLFNETLPTLTFDTLESDAGKVLEYVESLPAYNHVVLVGHSEGTVFASELSLGRADDSKLSSLVLIGVLATNMKDALRYQLTEGAILKTYAVAHADSEGRIFPRDIPESLKAGFPMAQLDPDNKGWISHDDLMRFFEPKYADFVQSIDTDRPDVLVLNKPAAYFKQAFTHKSLVSRAEEFHRPLYLIHGELDQNVPYRDNAVALYDLVKANQGEVKLRSFSSYGHCLSPNKQKLPTYGPMEADAVRAVVQFIEEGAATKPMP